MCGLRASISTASIFAWGRPSQMASRKQKNGQQKNRQQKSGKKSGQQKIRQQKSGKKSGQQKSGKNCKQNARSARSARASKGCASR